MSGPSLTENFRLPAVQEGSKYLERSENVKAVRDKANRQFIQHRKVAMAPAILMSLLLVLSIGTSEGAEQTAATREFMGAAFSTSSPQNWRRDFANAALVHCREVSAKVPRNTPREDDWVDGELKSLEPNRLDRLMKSVEFSRWTLAHTFEECVRLTQVLAIERLDKAKETATWVRLVRAFNDTDGLTKNGITVGLIRAADSSDPYGLMLWPGARLSIIEKAILPLLEEP